MASETNREYAIDGYPVSRQELLEQGQIISGKRVITVRDAARILQNDGRQVTKRPNDKAPCTPLIEAE